MIEDFGNYVTLTTNGLQQDAYDNQEIADLRQFSAILASNTGSPINVYQSKRYCQYDGFFTHHSDSYAFELKQRSTYFPDGWMIEVDKYNALVDLYCTESIYKSVFYINLCKDTAYIINIPDLIKALTRKQLAFEKKECNINTTDFKGKKLKDVLIVPHSYDKVLKLK